MYKEMQVLFLRCYTDAYICDDYNLYFISFFARPMVAKAIAAAIVQGRDVAIDGSLYAKRVPDEKMKVLTHNWGDLTHKIIYAPRYFEHGSMARIVVGEDKEAAFDFLDSIVSTPLKKEWKEWLWENAVEKQKLTAFGEIDGVKLDPVYLIRPIDHDMRVYDVLILNALRNREIC